MTIYRTKDGVTRPLFVVPRDALTEIVMWLSFYDDSYSYTFGD